MAIGLGMAVTTATLKRMVVGPGGYAMGWAAQWVGGYHRNPETHGGWAGWVCNGLGCTMGRRLPPQP